MVTQDPKLQEVFPDLPLCAQQYIAQMRKSLKERFSQHLGYVDRNIEETGKHFNLLGHSKSDIGLQSWRKYIPMCGSEKNLNAHMLEKQTVSKRGLM